MASNIDSISHMLGELKSSVETLKDGVKHLQDKSEEASEQRLKHELQSSRIEAAIKSLDSKVTKLEDKNQGMELTKQRLIGGFFGVSIVAAFASEGLKGVWAVLKKIL